MNTAILLLPHPYCSAAKKPDLAHASSPSGVKRELHQKDFRKYKIISSSGPQQYHFCKVSAGLNRLCFCKPLLMVNLCIFFALFHTELQSCASEYQTLLEITLADLGTSKVLLQFVVSMAFHQAELISLRHRDITDVFPELSLSWCKYVLVY